jgi:CheY-like chemotaxis protein
VTVVGSLEDLSFPDILQVIHVSRQSGSLILSTSAGGRRVRFHNGLVCGATLGEAGPELEDLLLQRGLIGAASLRAARERRALHGDSIAGALLALGAVSQETIDGVVREALRAILRPLVLLQEGEFRFEVEETISSDTGSGIGVSEGLGPESILQGMEGQGRARPARKRAPGAADSRSASRVLLVVERAVLRYRLKDELVRRGFEVETCLSPADALRMVRSTVGAGTALVLVSELMLPDPTGRGWRGGIELVRRAREIAPGVVAFVMGEVRDSSLEKEVGDAGGAGYLLLPDLGDAEPGEIDALLDGFCTRARDRIEHPDRTAPEGVSSASGPMRVADPLSLLRGLIGEMRAEEDTGIPLLVLRLAAEYFDRGVLFAVRQGEVCGAGAFGRSEGGGDDGAIDGRIRGVSLPLHRGSALQQAVKTREPFLGNIPRNQANAMLLDRLGDPAPFESALLPLLSGRHVFGILYGDNARSGRPLGDLKALEIFLAQAGMALENAFLQRRIATLARSREAGGRGGRGSASHA